MYYLVLIQFDYDFFHYHECHILYHEVYADWLKLLWDVGG